MQKYIGIIKHPVYKEQGYNISVSLNEFENKIILSWYDFSGEDFKFLNSEWAVLKTNELLNQHHEFVESGGGNGRDWMILKIL